MTQMAQTIREAGTWSGAPLDSISLDYEGRFVRRKRLTTTSGASVMLDLPQTRSLNDGDGLVVEGGLIEVVAAPEPLLRITGDLVRLAWHIGNRHTPCEVANDHLLIRADHVLADMLAQLGAEVATVEGPFRPEGGAYGHGRTHGHSHGPGEHAHGHHHGHDHASDHSHSHSHDTDDQ